MDVPGLNEISSNGNDVSDNFYFKEIIPIISSNIKFAILLFDCVKFNDNDTKDILVRLGDGIKKKDKRDKGKFGRNVIKNSIFILNKIDKVENNSIKGEKEKFINETINKIVNKKELNYLNKKLDNNNVIGISAKLLLKESFKFDSFNGYLDCIIEEAIQEKFENNKNNNDNKQFNNFFDYLFKKFRDDIYKIKKYKSNDSDEEEEEEEEEKEEDEKEEEEKEEEEEEEEEEKKLKKIKKLIRENFEDSFFSRNKYKYYEKLFNKYKNKTKGKKNQYIKYIENIFQEKMKKVIDEYFISFKNINTIEKQIQKFLHYSKSEMKMLTSNKIIILLNKLRKNPLLMKNKVNKVNNKINDIISEIDKICNFRIENEILNDYNRNKQYIEREKILNFLIIGGYSSGKSTLLNTVIIGKDIIPTSAKECTKIGLILKHVDSEEDIGLFKVDFKITKNDYHFKYNESKYITNDLNEIHNYLINFNQNKEIKFYLLKIPLIIFEYIDDYSLKNKIQFIDYPGLDTEFKDQDNNSLGNNNSDTQIKISKNTDALLKYTNGFIYVNNGIQVEENSNKQLLQGVLQNIQERKDKFSFKNCIFIFNKCDESEIDIKKGKENFIKLINNIQRNSVTYKKRLYNPNEIKNSNDIIVTKFSSYLFKEYLKNADKYDKENSNKYKSSNAEHLFKSLHKVINNSKDFYNSELENHEIRYCIKLNEDFSKILKSINNESKKINPKDFTYSKNQKRLNEFNKICKEESNNIKEEIEFMKKLIKTKISNMHKYKNETRNDFTTIAREIAKENAKTLDEYKIRINNKITDFINSLIKFIQNIEDLVKEKRKKNYPNPNELSLYNDNSSLTTNIREEDNLFIKDTKTTSFLILSLIPFYNIGFVGTSVAYGIWDHFRDHSIEFENIISEYKWSVFLSISTFECSILSNLRKIIKNYTQSVQELHSNYNKDLQRINNKKKIFKNIIHEYKQMLLSIVKKKKKI